VNGTGWIRRAVANRSDRRRQRPHDAGTALVEMSFVIVLLSLLLFGILTFGYIMSFKQNLTQAASDGARAGAVAPAGQAETRADAATDEAVGGFGQTCGSGGLTCTSTVGACPRNPTVQCVTETVRYDYANYPLLPVVPLLGGVMPDELVATSTAQINE
jgi:Flp pilus assembly protein TadG